MTNDTHFKVTGEYDASAIKVRKSKSHELGVRKLVNSVRFAYETKADVISLCLYKTPDGQPVCIITLDEYYKIGTVFSFEISGIKLDNLLYCYKINDSICVDTYASGLYSYNENGNTGYFGLLKKDKYNWEDDKTPGILPEDLIIYKLHPKGFTRNRFSKVKHKGLFAGIAEKIPYMKELGINAVELMPSYEIIDDTHSNYWGYTDGFYFSPRIEYSVEKQSNRDYTVEFKNMVKALHRAGIEVYIELFFKQKTHGSVIDDCVRFWKEEYHIDGVHLMCDERVRYVLAEDPFIKDLKLFYVNWYEDCNSDNLFEYNDGFLEKARKLIKGDEEQLQSFLYHMRRNPAHASNVNYVANNNGFTLADVYMYDRKHNEANGENNRDGIDYNLSWNCGVEGQCRKRKVNDLRNRLMKNAMTFLMLAQGVPLIYAGDEFGNSQDGNNNAYCQDNDTGWVDWSRLQKNHKFFEYVKKLIEFRKNHKILHLRQEPYLMDYKYFGIPDLSYHGVKAWYPDMEHYSRQAGILWCGKYADEEQDVYMAFNMHWEPHTLALPVIKDRKWVWAFSTADDAGMDIKGERDIIVDARTVVVLVNEKNS